MKDIKKTAALAAALVLTASLCACGGESESAAKETVTTVKKVEVNDTEEIDAISDDAQKELVWMGFYDLNPDESKGEDKSVEMTLFNNKGGTIKYNQVAYEERFDKLASALLSNNDVPDLFRYEWMAFPAQTIKDMYQPVDSIVDFDSPMWAETKATADQFVLGGKHFVAPISVSVGCMMAYDKDIIEANGLDDPYEEYLAGSWDWDTWTSMMSEFCLYH